MMTMIKWKTELRIETHAFVWNEISKSKTMKKGVCVCVCDKKRERNQKYIEKNQAKEILDEEFKLIQANSNSIMCPLCVSVVALTVVVVVAALLVYTSKCVSFLLSFLFLCAYNILWMCVYVYLFFLRGVFFFSPIFILMCMPASLRSHTRINACAQTNKRMNEQTNKPSNARDHIEFFVWK